MTSKATTVDQHIAELPDDRRDAIVALRKLILKNLPKGYEEGVQYGMIGYHVPHSIFPDGYHCDPRQPLGYLALASQKNYMSLYMCNIYGDARACDEFVKKWKATGKKLDMGKSCIRFKKLDDLALDVIAEEIKRVSVKDYIAGYTKLLAETKSRKKPATSGKK